MNGVFDASALLALFLKEDGHEAVTAALAAGAGMSVVNVSEVVVRCLRVGMPQAVASALLRSTPVEIVHAGLDLALRTAAIEAATRPFGLPMGDRYCLALAAREAVPALTADRQWARVGPLVGVEVELIR